MRIVPLDSPESPTTELRARTYLHPDLGARPVIRLEGDDVAAGADGEMAALGFGPPSVSAPLGRVAARTLGFPGWAFVHAPDAAAHALAVLPDLREAKALVAARPGTAKDAFEEIAQTLTKTAPVLLPSMWEEAGRAASEHGATTLAAQAFERARQAERAYDLRVDPAHADAVFVEFALAGALSAKTVSQYAKGLVKQAGGAEAFRRFRAILVQRARGGVPPYAGMGKDLAALAKAAKLDPTTETDALLAEMIDAPGIERAPAEMWSTWRASLVRLAEARPDVRARLRTLWPEPRGTDASRRAFREDAWLAILEDTGALADLPDDGLGAWVTRLIRYAGGAPRVVALLETLAPRLVAQRAAIGVVTRRPAWGYGLHLALAERALSLGVTLRGDVRDDDRFFPESMTVDPVAVATHRVYGPILVASVADVFGDPAHERRMRGKRGFAIARRTWVESRLGALEAGNLDELARTLDELERAPVFAELPDLARRLAAVDVGAALARTLREPTIDELGWPLYEEAFRRLGTGTSVGGAYPHLTLWSPSKALALGRDRIVAEHDLVYRPAEERPRAVWFDGGELVVDLSSGESYRSRAPKQRFPTPSRASTFEPTRISPAWADVPAPPAAFQPYFVPRDPASSAALRAITAGQGRALLDGVPLPAVRDHAIVRAVAMQTARAAELAERLRVLATRPPTDALSPEAAQLRAIAMALAAGKPAVLEDIEVDPRPWLVHGRGNALHALASTEIDERAGAREILRALAFTILAGDLTAFRLLEIDRDDDDDWGQVEIVREDASVFAIAGDAGWAIEHSLDGAFRPPPTHDIDGARPLRTLGEAWIAGVLALPDTPLALPASVIDGLDDDELVALLDEAAPDDPGSLVTDAWPMRLDETRRRLHGTRVELAPELVKAARAGLKIVDDELRPLLHAFASDAPVTDLTPYRIEQLLIVAGWLFLARPVGDPIRAGITGVVRSMRATLTDPRTVFRIAELWGDRRRRQMVIDLVRAQDAEGILLEVRPDRLVAAYRPAMLLANQAHLEQLVLAMEDEPDSAASIAELELVALALSDTVAALATRATTTPLLPGAYEANPLLSAPTVVAEVAATHALSPAAAALFLQTLALAEPTKRDVSRWNAWKPATYTAAASELARSGLLVEATRERAGRSLFLPGPFTKGNRDNLPIEDWKAPLYPLPRNVPVEPCHLLFARAWARWQAR